MSVWRCGGVSPIGRVVKVFKNTAEHHPSRMCTYLMIPSTQMKRKMGT